MRVNIEHEEIRKGMLKKKTYHAVKLTVEFSEEEQQIIKQRDLTRTIVMKRDVPVDRNARSFEGHEDVFNLTIYNLLNEKTESYALATPAAAKQYEADLTEALKNLKAYLQENVGVEEKSKTFEL